VPDFDCSEVETKKSAAVARRLGQRTKSHPGSLRRHVTPVPLSCADNLPPGPPRGGCSRWFKRCDTEGSGA
jgi:hypothetical protein